MRRKFLAGMVASCAMLLALGCGEEGQPSGKGAGGKKGAKKLTFAVVPKAKAFRFWPAVIEGARAAAKELGIETVVNAARDENAFTEQIQIVEAMITQEVDGIVLAPLNADTLVPVVEKAVKAGIPVVIIDSGINTDKIVSFIATDNYQGGVMGAERLAKAIGDEGDVALVMNIQGSASTEDRERGFLEAIAKHPKIKVVAKQYAKGDPAKGNRVVTEILTANENLKGIFAVNEPGAEGALLAVKNKGLTGKVKIVGFDASEILISGIRDGSLDATIVQAPFDMGYRGVKTLADHLNGKTVEPVQKTPIVLVTKDNLDTPEVQKHLSAYKDIREVNKGSATK